MEYVNSFHHKSNRNEALLHHSSLSSVTVRSTERI